MKYLYLILLGGFNDILCGIKEYYKYCKKTNRKLYINTYYSPYKINLCKSMRLSEDLIINQDDNNFLNFIKGNISIYPSISKNILLDIINNKLKIKTINRHTFKFNKYNIILNKPELNNEADLIIYARFGGGDSFKFFKKKVFFRKSITEYCNHMLNKIEKPYISIQIRNTDLKTDYKDYIKKYDNLIKKYNRIYIATDDINVLNYFKSNKLKIYNFTTFPDNKYSNLHGSEIDGKIKFRDLICDLFLIINSEEAIIESKSGFSYLLKKCFIKKEKILKKFTM